VSSSILEMHSFLSCISSSSVDEFLEVNNLYLILFSFCFIFGRGLLFSLASLSSLLYGLSVIIAVFPLLFVLLIFCDFGIGKIIFGDIVKVYFSFEDKDEVGVF